MATINDHRSDESKARVAYGFVLFTDKFMSGWGGARGGRSLYALQVESQDEAYRVLASGKRRSEMKRGRFVKMESDLRKRAKGRDHLSIADKSTADRWYAADGFGEPSE